MGGPGSGSGFRWSRKSTLEGCIAIDVRVWQRSNLLKPGCGFAWQWKVDDEASRSIDVTVRDGHVQLSDRQRPQDGDRGALQHIVFLVHTDCHYGGRRVWFACPRCQRRAAKIYAADSRFVCRRCCGLPYACQGESRCDRALRQSHKLRRRLGAGLAIGDPIWIKPKGMHQHTFDRLARRIEAQDEAAITGSLALSAQLTRRFS